MELCTKELARFDVDMEYHGNKFPKTTTQSAQRDVVRPNTDADARRRETPQILALENSQGPGGLALVTTRKG